jgi:hypothetical protein
VCGAWRTVPHPTHTHVLTCANTVFSPAGTLS